MERLVWISLGGMLGTAARYGLTLWAEARFGSVLPLRTLLVNLTGCFAMGP